jgi:cation transport ATPase
MAILVVCPNCRARFQVSEKFAGKQGPCPKCKGVINIPALDEQVKIHAPQDFAAGGKDAKGRPVLKPVARTETKIQPVMAVAMVGAVILLFAVAFVLRKMHLDAATQTIVLGAGAVLLAPPLVIGGYSFLRNQELEPYRGTSLIIRTAICSAVYAAFWLAHYFVPDGMKQEMWNWLFLGIPPLLVCSLTALGAFDLDFGSAFFHYTLYLVVCVLLRLTMGLHALYP